ncbi:MAG: YceI family protein [Bdellovibrionales bacterium]|nr:YceI family protein [Bdellovibrionales bacterium]
MSNFRFAITPIAFMYLANISFASSNTWVRFKIGYTLGTHEGTFSTISKQISGTQDPFTWKGQFKVKLEDAEISDRKLKCHFLESMGVDYSKSAFPKSHVCTSDDQLPKEGPDSIAYPEIVFSLDQVSPAKESGRYLADGTWTIHGVSKKVSRIPFEIHDGYVRLSTQIHLKDFGIQVKGFLFISTADTAEVEIQVKP